jgi:hypothetical protein
VNDACGPLRKENAAQVTISGEHDDTTVPVLAQDPVRPMRSLAANLKRLVVGDEHLLYFTIMILLRSWLTSTAAITTRPLMTNWVY